MPGSNLRLFSIKMMHSNEIVRVGGKLAYFSSKLPAKAKRDQLAQESGEDYAVVLGPDHCRFKEGGAG